MKINDFKLERYFAIHEFTAKYLLSSSDCDGHDMKDILNLATTKELDLWNNLKLGYTECEGHPLLRESILNHYKLENIENVVVASPGELNFIAMNILLTPTDHVITVSPAYQSLFEVVNSIGSEISYWNPNKEDWKFDVTELEKLIKDNTKLIILNFPHNPTGAYLTAKQQKEIVAIARKHNITIFSDEMYHKLISDEAEELQPISDIYEKGISLWGTSKSYGLAGLRTGWLVSQDKEFLKKIVAFKDYLSICTSGPSEILTIIALNHSDSFIQPNIQKINRNVSLFKSFAKEHDIFSSFIPPVAGSTAFIKLNIEGSTIDFCNKLVEETGVMTVPEEMFNYQGNYLRIGFGRENFPKILEILDDYLG